MGEEREELVGRERQRARGEMSKAVPAKMRMGAWRGRKRALRAKKRGVHWWTVRVDGDAGGERPGRVPPVVRNIKNLARAQLHNPRHPGPAHQLPLQVDRRVDGALLRRGEDAPRGGAGELWVEESVRGNAPEFPRHVAAGDRDEQGRGRDLVEGTKDGNEQGKEQLEGIK